MHVFDAHTHFFSRAFYEFQARQVPDADVPTLLEKMAGNGIDVPGESIHAHRDRIISDLDENGIDRAVSFASVPEEMEIVGEAAKTSDGRLVPYAMVNPKVSDTLKRFETLHDQYKFKGMLLFPAMQDFAIGGDIAAPGEGTPRPLRAALGDEPEQSVGPLERDGRCGGGVGGDRRGGRHSSPSGGGEPGALRAGPCEEPGCARCASTRGSKDSRGQRRVS